MKLWKTEKIMFISLTALLALTLMAYINGFRASVLAVIAAVIAKAGEMTISTSGASISGAGAINGSAAFRSRNMVGMVGIVRVAARTENRTENTGWNRAGKRSPRRG